MEKHFCVTVYIIKDNQVLLIDHKKLGKWLPAGGHIEPNESPEEAAIREVKEETNLSVDLIPMNSLSTAWGVQENFIKENHYHYDVIYLAKPTTDDIKQNLDETNGIKWFDVNEINDPLLKKQNLGA